MQFGAVDDWGEATTEQRKRLYKAVAAAAKARTERVKITLAVALGPHKQMGTDYVSNFRQGRIARELCPIIQNWLAQHHLPNAQGAAPELFPADPYHVWETALNEQSQPGRLRLITIKPSFGLIQRADSVEPVDQTLRLRQPFLIEIDVPFAGHLHLYQWHANVWHLSSLHADGAIKPLKIIEGTHRLPRNPRTGAPIPLTEATDVGLHRFAIALSKHNQTLFHNLKQLTKVPEGSFLAERHVQIIGD
ncbi:MAG: hypothetical protein AAFQ05_10580 [Pseudomonadota bacterium]